MRYIDLIGQRFGTLLVLEPVATGHGMKWSCRCDCGGKSIAYGGNLRAGRTRSCGCREGPTTHGRSETPTYKVWTAMKQRCLNPKACQYDDYGGRGITVSKRWMAFENFLADMGECPKGLSLERKKNDQGYTKRNCLWTTRAANNRNTRRNHHITYRRQTKLLVEWAEHFGVDPQVLRARIMRRSVDEVFAELAA